MKKIKYMVCIVLLLLFSNMSFITTGLNDRIFNTIYVDDDNIDGPWDGSIEHPFRYIQNAIDFSENGDKIIVSSGRYGGDIIVNKSITLHGENSQNTIIDASIDNWGFYIAPSFDAIDDLHVNILGFTIKDTHYPYEGICINSGSMYVENCVFINNEYNGIYMEYNRNNSIISSEFYNNGVGININNSDRNYISKNLFNSEFGIYINSDENTITDNIFIQCGIDYSSTSENNTISNNTVNNKPLIFLDEKNNMTIENAGQIILEECENITIQNNDVTNASIGVQLFNSENCIIHSNDLSNNYDGITLMYSHHNYIEKNKINSVFLRGIYAYVSHFNTFEKNIFEDFMNYGIYLDYSWINEVQHNFIKSHYQSYGICIYYSGYNDIVSNTISLCTKGVYQHFWCNHTEVINNTIDSCVYSGLGLWNCSYVMFSNNNISGCRDGIEISDSDNISINYNIISNNEWGINCDSTLNFEILNNMIGNNSHVGILQFLSSGIISKNIFNDNWAATFFANNHEIFVTENNFFNHHINLHFVKSNKNPNSIHWDNNYWENWPLNLPKPILGMRFLIINILVPLPSIEFDMNPAKVPHDLNFKEINNEHGQKSSESSLNQIDIPSLPDQKTTNPCQYCLANEPILLKREIFHFFL